MNIPKIWQREERDVAGKLGPMRLTAWGWSDADPAEAKRRAAEKLERMASRVVEGLDLPDRYAYGERPLREEIVRELRAGDGALEAVVTRNAQGCLVLNAAHVWFADVDLPPVRRRSLLARWFSRQPPVEEKALERIRRGLQGASRSSFRVYRTAGGFRLLATERLFEPGSSEAEAVMAAVGADPAFVRLCRAQQSFRARLSPKPWRCDAGKPPHPYPREEDAERRRFADWLAAYEKRAAPWATCSLVEQVGAGRVHERVRAILELHDQACRVGVSAPLA